MDVEVRSGCRSWGIELEELLMINERARNGTAAMGTEVVMLHEGGPEVLRVGWRETLVPASGEAVVRVEAAGVSFAEVQMLRGRYFNQPKFPFVPGYDLVGTAAYQHAVFDGLSAGQPAAWRSLAARQLLSRIARFVAPQHSPALLPKKPFRKAPTR